MFQFIVTEDGGLTWPGYAVFIAVGILFLLAGAFVQRKEKKMAAKELVYCSAAIALAFLASYIRLAKMPWGGSITLCSMLFISMIGYWYGIKTGIMTGLAYGILQFLQEPYVLSGFQVCCDYVFAFAALGLSGVFANSKNGLLKGFLFGAFMRGVFHSLGGYLYWMAYMPENFPKELTLFYPILYNYAYIGAEALITVLLISVPSVKKSMEMVKRFARE